MKYTKKLSFFMVELVSVENDLKEIRKLHELANFANHHNPALLPGIRTQIRGKLAFCHAHIDRLGEINTSLLEHEKKHHENGGKDEMAEKN